jgi:hypothetical protein
MDHVVAEEGGLANQGEVRHVIPGQPVLTPQASGQPRFDLADDGP